jgi:hypothetical protein
VTDPAQRERQSCVKCGAEIPPSRAVVWGACASCWNEAAEAVGAEDRKICGCAPGYDCSACADD